MAWLWTDRLKALARQRAQRRVMIIGGLAYWLLYLLAVQDLRLHTDLQSWSARLARDPWSLLLQTRGPFQFEPIALIQGPLFTWTASPGNVLIGLVLATLVGLNLALAWTAVFQPTYCNARPSTGLAAALPGLLAGSACCGPAVFIILGIPVTASVIGVFSILVPLAAVLLIVALGFNLHQLYR